MTKKTIIYLGGFEFPDKNAAAHRVLGNGKAMRELGYNVVFIGIDRTLKYTENTFDSPEIFEGFECWSIPYPKTPMNWINYLSNVDNYLEIIKQYPQIHAVICYNYQSLAFIKIRNYCRKNDIKILADITEWYSTKGASVPFKVLKGLDTFLRMRVIHKKLDGLIVISEFLGKYYSKCANVQVIPPLVDFNQEKWTRKSQEKVTENLTFVYAGQPGRNKDKLNLLIEALSSMKIDNYSFKIVGLSKKEYLDIYKNHKKILDDMSKQIVFLGRVDHIESLNIIKNSDFSLIIRESTRVINAGFPTKFVESISCGTPVISTNVSDLRHYLIDGENGFFVTKNQNDIIAKLEDIIGLDMNQIFAMKQKCLSIRTFSYENFIDTIRNVLQTEDDL